MTSSGPSLPPRPPLSAAAVPDPSGSGGGSTPTVQIVRSARRQRTISAYRDGDRTIVRVPAGMSPAAEQRTVEDMLRRLERKEARAQRARPDDGELMRRAVTLSREFLDGKARPVSVRWVTNQNTRWGSCTPRYGTIRLSHKLRTMPAWVIDYVLVHELAHLLVHSHGPEFWALVERYPRTERARGFLEGVVLAAGLDLAPDADEGVDDAAADDADEAADGPAA